MSRPTDKVPKAYDTFPLFAPRNWTWCKKIDGERKSFGPVRWPDKEERRRIWTDALDAYNRHREAVARGFEIAADPRSIDVGMLHDGSLTLKLHEAETGMIKARHFADMRNVLRLYRDTLRATTTVAEVDRDPSPIHSAVRPLV